MRLLRSRLLGVSLAVAGLASTAAASLDSATNTSTLDNSPTTATASAADSGTSSGTGLSGGDSSSGDVITFTAEDFIDNHAPYNDDSVYIDTESDNVNGIGKSFGFTVKSTSYKVTDAQLREDLNGSVIASASNITTDTQQGKSPVSIVLSVQPATGSDTQSGTVTIPNTGLIFDNGYSGRGLFFEILWSQGDGVYGSSYSRNFTFVNNNPSVIATALPQFTNTNPVLPETRFGGSSQTVTGAGAATGTATTVRGATANPTAANGGASLSSSHSSSTGLSHGAIAGIVIGAVAGIALIAGLIFFFYRRHRNDASKKAYNSALMSGSVEPYRGAGPISDLGGPHGNLHPNLHDGLGSGTAVNLMEKDAIVAGGRFAGDRDGGPNTPHSPHSPYSDEEGTPQIIPSRSIATGTAAASSAAASAAASPTVRSAQNVTPAVSPVAAVPQPAATAPVAGAAGAAATPPVIRGQVAALIEDHMTPEDVARLEAEERELDADIENAIRNRAASRQR